MRKLWVITILSLLLLLTLVRADWVFSGIEGDWNYTYQNIWESPYSSTYSYFTYNTSISNFQHFKTIIALESYDVGGYWEISKAHQLIVFQLHNPNLNFSITFLIDHCLRIHLAGYKDVLTRSCIMKNDGEIIIPTAEVIRNMFVEIHAWKRTDNKLVVAYMYKYDPFENATTVFFEEVLDVDADWFDNVVITQRVEKYCEWGAGAYIKGSLAELKLTSGSGLAQSPYQHREIGWIETYRRNFWIIDILFQAGNFLWSMLTLLWNFIIPNLPLIFSVYVFYLLYLIVLSLEDGNFGRLLDHFLKIGQFFISIIQAIYQGINTIISHFSKWLSR